MTARPPSSFPKVLATQDPVSTRGREAIHRSGPFRYLLALFDPKLPVSSGSFREVYRPYGSGHALSMSASVVTVSFGSLK